ncbi:MAG TPA: hypothetical protein VEL31_00715 [Ktedonobacteraceae bacterium]|nr:hypothetical protein [Ktedonobacteraceae bacterium]
MHGLQYYLFEVLDSRERIIKVMEESSPFLICGGASKADCMILQPFPPDEQEISPVHFDAPVQLVRDVAGHRRDDARGVFERSFEVALLAWFDL